VSLFPNNPNIGGVTLETLSIARPRWKTRERVTTMIITYRD